MIQMRPLRSTISHRPRLRERRIWLRRQKINWIMKSCSGKRFKTLAVTTMRRLKTSLTKDRKRRMERLDLSQPLRRSRMKREGERSSMGCLHPRPL